MNLSIPLEHPDKRTALFGASDRYLRLLRETFGVTVVSRDEQIKLSGEAAQVGKAAAVLQQMQKKLRKQDWLSDRDVSDAIRIAAAESGPRAEGELDVFVRGQAIAGKTPGQAHYLQGMLNHDLTFCTGPAGTGKTYLAVAVAAHLLKRGSIKRIILARPAVEAGEKLGFLPGDLAAKVNPYLRPLFDALNDMIDFEAVRRMMASDIIEVIPLAFMRGRTLNDSCIILDEAQNSTVSQMFMFLTRLGHNSKMIVTGDTSQVDLPDNEESGLLDAIRRTHGIPQVFNCRLERDDIVRHTLVQHIVNAYGEQDVRPQRKRAFHRTEPARGPSVHGEPPA